MISFINLFFIFRGWTVAMLREHKLFDPPMWKGESLTSNIFGKIDSPENKEIDSNTKRS